MLNYEQPNLPGSVYGPLRTLAWTLAHSGYTVVANMRLTSPDGITTSLVLDIPDGSGEWLELTGGRLDG